MAPKVITLSPVVSIRPPSPAPAATGRSNGGGLRTNLQGDHGPIPPSDPANVLQNTSPPTQPMTDPNVAPIPSAPYRPVVQPPAPGPASPAAPLVP